MFIDKATQGLGELSPYELSSAMLFNDSDEAYLRKSNVHESDNIGIVHWLSLNPANKARFLYGYQRWSPDSYPSTAPLDGRASLLTARHITNAVNKNQFPEDIEKLYGAEADDAPQPSLNALRDGVNHAINTIIATYPRKAAESCGPSGDVNCYYLAKYGFYGAHRHDPNVHNWGRLAEKDPVEDPEDPVEENKPTPSPSGTVTEKRIPGYRPSALNYPPAQTAGINLTHLALGGIALYAAYHYLVKK